MFLSQHSDELILSRQDAAFDFITGAQSANFKLLHPLLIARYSKVTLHHSDKMFPMVGLDVETDHTTGEPKLLGFSYEDGYYFHIDDPTLSDLFSIVNSLINNSPGTNLVTWGTLDIMECIRLFNPTEIESKRTSRGVGGNYKNGKWIAEPPIMRQVNGTNFFVDHYIKGRSLRLGIEQNNRTWTIWIYNISQFYPTRIADSAKGLGLEWIDYSEDTHLIDWDRYLYDSDYQQEVLKSNEQDARTVRTLAQNTGAIFNRVFGAYPKLLVSAGSLADSAVSKMLNQEEYASNAWRYLHDTTFKDSPFIDLAESIISEAYSAGYVDQFGIGYFDRAYTADISSAYPHKIRKLPDLTNFSIIAGKGNPQFRKSELEEQGYKIFTAAIRGRVTIPEHLRFHPITLKTSQSQNFRPIGTFNASYMLEERDFCQQWGAHFENEVWVLFATKKWKTSAIAKVSEKLAKLRDEYREKMINAATAEESILYDSMQYMVKVVDNSLYGKTVASIAIIEDIDGIPQQTGWKAGDRYNQLYGAWITACTRVQVADACMTLQQAGSEPIMAMTDAVYWTGDRNHLPEKLIASHKTAGLFEPPEVIEQFYVIKTGQYEYKVPCNCGPDDLCRHWHHKVRGFNIDWQEEFDNPLNLKLEDLISSRGLYRDLIKEWSAGKESWHPDEVVIPVPTRKLLSVGTDFENMGLIKNGESNMRPFVLSGKSPIPWIEQWPKAIDDHVWIPPAIVDERDEEGPLQFISGLHESGENYLNRYQRKQLFYYLTIKCTNKRGKDCFLPGKLSNLNWEKLEEWSGMKREWAHV